MTITGIFAQIASISPPNNPDDSSARELAERELAKSKYHDEPSLWERIIQWINDHLWFSIDGLSSNSTANLTMIMLGILLAGIIIFLLVKYLRSRASSTHKPGGEHAAPLFDDIRSAEQLFTAAEQARLRGDKPGVIVENFRGVMRLLDEHGVIVVRPGLTATEAAAQGSSELGQSELFIDSAYSFNCVYFSSMPATDAAVATVDKLVTFVRTCLKNKENSRHTSLLKPTHGRSTSSPAVSSSVQSANVQSAKIVSHAPRGGES